MTFDPFASMNSSVPEMHQTDDDIDFDQFLKTITDAGGPNAYPVVDDQGGNDDDPEVPDPEATPPASVDPATPPVDPPATVRIGDQDVPLADVQALYEIGRSFRDAGIAPPATPPGDPVVAPPADPPAPTEPTYPEWLDQDDPAQMAMFKELQESRSEIAAIRAQGDQAIAAANQKRLVEEVNAGVAAFRAEHPDLTEADITTLRTLAGPTADAFVKAAGNPVEGIKKALFVAGLDYNPTRDRLLGQSQQSSQQKSSERKKKLGSLGASSGSAPRGNTPSRTRPTTDREATSQFAEQLAEAFGQTGRLN